MNSPQPHFPSPYQRPSTPPTIAESVKMPDGAHIATYVYGSQAGLGAMPILMLHGNGEEHGIFGPMIDAALQHGKTVIALDSRAQGKSTRGTARLTYELLAQDALAAMDALGATRAHVMGFSDGAIEGLLMARDHPDRVASLLSIGANLTPDGIIDDNEGEGGWDIATLVSSYRAWATWVRNLTQNGITGIDPTLLSPTLDEAQNTADLLQLMLDEPHIEAKTLAGISCPTTVMVGENDVISPTETRAIVEGIKAGGNQHVRLVVVPEAEHTLPKHEPELVTQELLRLVANN